MADRKRAFYNAIEGYDELGLKGAVSFDDHRFVSVEHDKQTEDRFVKGHKTIRGACGHLQRAVAGGDPFVPEFILDLDTGERHELDVLVTVVPRSVEAVNVIMPLSMATDLAGYLSQRKDDVRFRGEVAIIQQAIDRR